MDLRRERLDDHGAVRDLHLVSFGDQGVVADLVDDLRRELSADVGASLVAMVEGEIVGHVMLTRSLLDAPRQLVDVQVLGPVAVLPELQGQGIGSTLIRAALVIMVERSVPVVFLEGPPAYYSRFGFGPGAEQGFRKPSLRIPNAAFQAIRLPAFESWMSGTLVYSDTFWRHDAVGLR